MYDGGSGPAVLLLHGSGPGTTAAAWTPLIAALEPRHRVIAPDLLGFGASAAPPARRSLRAAWTAQATAARRARDRAVRGRRQLGGRGDRALARARAPGRWSRRSSPSARWAIRWRCPPGSTRCGATSRAATRRARCSSCSTTTRRAATPEAVDARLEATLAQPHYRDAVPGPAPALGRRPLADARRARRDRRAGAARPRRAGPHRAARATARCALLQLLPDVRAHVFGGCGHATPLERTDEFNRLLTTFLETDR